MGTEDESAKEKEQALEASKEEKPEESSEPADVSEAVKMFEEDRKKESSEEAAAEEKKKEDKPAEETPLEAKLFIVDEKGTKVPFIVKADDKEHAPDTVEKAIQWTGLGIHANAALAEMNKEREEFQKAKPFLSMIQEAYEGGRLKIDDKVVKPGEEVVAGEKVEEEEEEEELEIKDPAVEKIQKRLEKTEKKLKEKDEEELKRTVQEFKSNIDAQIVKAAPAYFAAVVRTKEDSPKEVWDLLSEKNEDGSLKYPNVEDAVKASHESTIAFTKKVIEAHPEEFKIDEDAIYARKLKEKQEKEEKHVQSPSEEPAGGEPKPDKEMEFEGPQEAYLAFQKEMKKKEAAAQKS